MFSDTLIIPAEPPPGYLRNGPERLVAPEGRENRGGVTFPKNPVTPASGGRRLDLTNAERARGGRTSTYSGRRVRPPKLTGRVRGAADRSSEARKCFG